MYKCLYTYKKYLFVCCNTRFFLYKIFILYINISHFCLSLSIVKLNKIYIVINLFVVFNICIFNLFNKNITKYFYHLWTVSMTICCLNKLPRLKDILDSMFASNAVDHGFKPLSGQTKDHKIGICCFSAKQAALRRKNKDYLVRYQDNVSEWGNMSIRVLFSELAL